MDWTYAFLLASDAGAPVWPQSSGSPCTFPPLCPSALRFGEKEGSGPIWDSDRAAFEQRAQHSRSMEMCMGWTTNISEGSDHLFNKHFLTYIVGRALRKVLSERKR